MMQFLTFFLTALSLLTVFLPVSADNGLPSEEAWWTAVCRGEKLDGAMRWSEPQANSFLEPLHSPWDGNLIKEFALWGYTESFHSILCDFDETWNLDVAFRGLGIDPRSTARGGSNQCFVVQHGSRTSPMILQPYYVGGREYRVTSATSVIGINQSAGMIFFINIKSPGKAAESYWGYKPRNEELPALRAQSDYAWGFWVRMHNAGAVKNINALWSTKVINKSTRQILAMAFQTYKPQPGTPKVDSPQLWPGTDFDISTVEGQAILGSPNGIGPGYFLAQHKRQFGGNKMIYKITVFKDGVRSDLPSLIFWVKDAPNVQKRANNSEMNESSITSGPNYFAGGFEKMKILNTSTDGKSVLREHIIRAVAV